MLQRVDLREMEDFYLPLMRRTPVGAYFVRVTEYGDTVREWIWKCREAALRRGAVIDGGLRNPDGRELSRYRDVLGDGFETGRSFILEALLKWMPGTPERVRLDLASAIANEIGLMKRAGKTDSMIRNTYIKLMCWLNFRFGSAVPLLGQDDVPKVLYCGDRIGAHEMIMLRIIGAVGSDILAAETKAERGDAADAEEGQRLKAPDPKPFPEGFSLRRLGIEKNAEAARTAKAPGKDRTAGDRGKDATAAGVRGLARIAPAGRTPGPRPAAPAVSPAATGGAVRGPERIGKTGAETPGSVSRASDGNGRKPREVPGSAVRGLERIGQRPVGPAAGGGAGKPAPRRAVPTPDIEKRFPAPRRSVCSNAWIAEPGIGAILTPPENRGEDPALYYTAFIRCLGVRDRMTYASELYQLYREMTDRGRTPLVLDGPVPQPETDEIDAIRRRSYRSADEMIVDLAVNLPHTPQAELEREMRLAFVRAAKRAAEEEENIRRLTVSAVVALCWIRRYHAVLFKGWKETDVPAVFKTGGCDSAAEVLFFRYLSHLPVDILILCPDLSAPCSLKDERLLDLKGEESMKTMPFPRQSGGVKLNTAASSAEQELTEMLYTDSGLYRDRQFERAEVITLSTTLDEIFILWDQEMKYRPNFSAVGKTVNIPVIFARISGVKNGKTGPYWQRVKQLKDAENTFYFDRFPILSPGEGGKYQKLAARCVKNEKLLTDELRSAREYPFGLLRPEMQDHIFSKLQAMLDQRVIKGTFVNGTEYTVVSTVLSIGKDMLRAIQAFDFTRRNPKAVVVSAGETPPTLEDAVLLTFLSEIGFDVVMFVPTGYQMTERFLSGRFPVDHQNGEYMYDLEVPDLNTLPAAKGFSWLNNLLKR